MNIVFWIIIILLSLLLWYLLSGLFYAIGNKVKNMKDKISKNINKDKEEE